MEGIEGENVGTKRFLIFRLRVGDRRGTRPELVGETDLRGQAERLPALLAAEPATTRTGTTLRGPKGFSYEALCSRTGRVVARRDAGELPPAWALEVLGPAGSTPAAA